jgi:putative Ca2+/H+ antiporter (TMEM165/GDT1 family)
VDLISKIHTPWDAKLFVSTFSLIFVAELPDKTAFATLILATRRNPFAIFIGVAAAFVIQSLVAVSFGSVLSALPQSFVKFSAALLFFLFAWLMWKREEPEEDEVEVKGKSDFLNTIWTSFVVIFIAEWGDLTQLATATLSAQYANPVTIFSAATLALWTVTAIAILVGNRAKSLINPNLLKKVAAIAFVGVGVYMLIAAVRTM